MKQLSLMVFIVILLCITCSTIAQPQGYSPANAHSHNDYEQAVPFYAAYKAGFGSIEADIFLRNDSLLVAHHAREITPQRTLETMYLKPLQEIIKKNQGNVYADSSQNLQLMIDIKTEAVATLSKLIQLLQQYPQLINAPSLRIVISGNRPEPAVFTTYPTWIWFDGIVNKEYSSEALSRILMMSDNFKEYTSWNGTGTIPAEDWTKLQKAVANSHALKKKVRFWGAPDAENAWKQFMELQVDYINTDSINTLGVYLKRVP